MNYLLDTNVLSEFKRPKPDAHVLAWSVTIDEDRTFISAVSIGELRRGAALLPQGRRKSELDQWISETLLFRFDGRVLNITREVAESWGELMASAQRRGVGLHPIDAYLAATATVHRLTLVTRNIKDFKVTGVRLMNPWSMSLSS